MEPGIDPAPAFHLYSCLPWELRLCIIEQFLLDLRILRIFKTMGGFAYQSGLLGKYATVDRLWQAEVEKLTFQSLRLLVDDHRNDLDAFDRICIGDRINLVSRISLRIRLKVSLWGMSHISYDHDPEMRASTLRAGQEATEVFCRLFCILQKWTRKGQLLGLTYQLESKYTDGVIDYSEAARCEGLRLRIDSSSFPEVPCVGSLRTIWQRGSEGTTLYIQPISACQILSKLPNVTHADMELHGCMELPKVVEILEGQPTPSLQGPRLKHLRITCTSKWRDLSSLGQISRSPELNQSIYAMTCRLEEVRLDNVVSVPSFLRHSCGARGSTSQSSPAWPNLKKLSMRGYTDKQARNGRAVKEEFHDSVTQALRQMPDLTDLAAMEYSDYHGRYLMFWMQVPPRRDYSAMPDAKICWNPPEFMPERETVDTWRTIVRSQWHCGLVSVPHGYRYYGQWGFHVSTTLHHDPLR